MCKLRVHRSQSISNPYFLLYFIAAKNANKLTSNKVHVAIREKAHINQSNTKLPDQKWQNEQITEFSKTRAALARHIAFVQKPGVPNKKRHKLPSKTNERGNIWLICVYDLNLNRNWGL